MILDLLDPEAMRFAHALYRLWRFKRWRRRYGIHVDHRDGYVTVEAGSKVTPEQIAAAAYRHTPLRCVCPSSLRAIREYGADRGPGAITVCTPAWVELMTEVGSEVRELPRFLEKLHLETPGGRVSVLFDPSKHRVEREACPPAPQS